MKKEILIREFDEKDLNEILFVFNTFVKNSFAAYCEDDLTIGQIKKMFEPARITLVLQENERVIGFGFISRYKPFDNFNETGVLTYFILPKYTGQGFGTRLFNELISKGRKSGITNYLAHISSKNIQSLNFHKKKGFEEVGRFKDVASKFGETIDVVWVQKILNQGE